MSATSKPQTEGFRNKWRSRIVRHAWVDPNSLLLNPKNWRLHPEHQQKVMESVLDSLGWADSVTIQDGTDLVIDGHMRCGMAITKGELVYATYLDLDDNESDQLLSLFDPIGAMARKDEDQYRELVTNTDYDDDLVRRALLADDELSQRLLREAHRSRLGDTERMPDVPERPVVSSGEIWLLGRHVLAIGDCNDVALVERARAAGNLDLGVLCYTDPPYNADYTSRVDDKRPQPFGGITNDAMSEDDYGRFIEDALISIEMVTTPGASIYVWCDDDHYGQVERLYQGHFTKRAMIVWDKTHFGMGAYYRNQHELMIFGTRGEPRRWNAGHNERNVWAEPRDPAKTYKHPTQKPVALAERAIANSSDEGEVVVDLFGGSGSTLIGCEKLERRCLIVELEPRWAEVIIRRYLDYVGDGEALRAEDEVSFVDL